MARKRRVSVKEHMIIFANNSDHELNINISMSSICEFKLPLHAVIVYVPYINHVCLGKHDTNGRLGMWRLNDSRKTPAGVSVGNLSTTRTRMVTCGDSFFPLQQAAGNIPL